MAGRRSRAWLASAALLAPALGCLGAFDGGDVTVATAWPEAERARIEAEAGRARPPVRVRWVVLAPGDDIGRVARWRRPPDVLLGGPAAAYSRLDEAGALEAPGWRVARRAPTGFAVNARTGPVDAPPGPLAFDDPRRDALALAWIKAVLARGAWAGGYAELVREAGGPASAGPWTGGAVAAVARGDAGRAPAAEPLDGDPAGATAFRPQPSWPAWIEGVAVVKGAPNPDGARALMGVLGQIGRAGEPGPDDTADDGAEADGLLADLLGAALVEAHDELTAAWEALERAGHPARAEAWMTAPPPWPPASVAVLLGQQEGSAMPLVEALAAEVAPGADARAWLLRSWLAPTRTVDGALLREIAGAAGGRLAREPRFRAWLRGEWTAWARQRFRRVARSAAGELQPAAKVAAGGTTP